ncbi:MAG TPA: HepT-like ribonuclease domain-containing protein [Cyclobacteriaceae bacterium]|nr:HepT-like ribonuclease domain-containing protein [Cyclobacteriaceae bacterium]
MQRESKKHLHDIKVSLDSIFDFLGKDPSLAEYHSNKLLRRAVERELEIIGEATNRLLKTEPGINISMLVESSIYGIY